MTPGYVPARMKRTQNAPVVVVHPLFDRPEEKLRPDHLPPIRMKRSVQLSLMTLRVYLVLMVVMFGYHFLDLTGMLRHHGR